jgi:hypothetical protein
VIRDDVADAIRFLEEEFGYEVVGPAGVASADSLRSGQVQRGIPSRRLPASTLTVADDHRDHHHLVPAPPRSALPGIVPYRLGRGVRGECGGRLGPVGEYCLTL